MAFRCIRLLRFIKNTNVIPRTKSTAITTQNEVKINKPVEFSTETKLIYMEDPDMFGSLSRNVRKNENKFENEDDVKEQEYLSNIPLRSQKLTTRQYADLIKQYLAHKRLKEAIDVLEVRMLKEDRVKPENYIYNILIGACAEFGYTKKAFKLFNDMKKRALKPTGDTYTCLFHACANSPWAADGLKNAHRLRELMAEKGVEPNITNFNAMIKAFGRCGDLPTAFQIVDEMKSKKIKIRVHTFNHLLHGCIADKIMGLRHALVVWRKMLIMREKPNLYSFNLILKCVKDCNLGTKEDIEELIGILSENIGIESKRSVPLQIGIPKIIPQKTLEQQNIPLLDTSDNEDNLKTTDCLTREPVIDTDLVFGKNDDVSIIVEDFKKIVKEQRAVPNLLSKVINMQQVLALQEVHTMQDKFAVIGGQEDFLQEMELYSVKPDIKTFTQMVPLLGNTREAEIKLLDNMKALEVKADIDIYNNLIKKRCLRSDYDGAFVSIITIIISSSASSSSAY
jgi:pentatricopeptide repeat domain-containing protein 1